MTWRRLSFAALALSAGCSVQQPSELKIAPGGGSSSGGETTPGFAKAFYLERVDPEFQGTCAACHATGAASAPIWLVAGDGEASYAKIESFYDPAKGGALIAIPDNSLIILQGLHTGPDLTPDQEAKVREWLTLEATERGLAGAPPAPGGGGEGGSLAVGATGAGTGGGGAGGAPPVESELTAAEALAQFGACMSLTDWKEKGMHLLYSRQTVGAGPCVGCHSSGQMGAYLSSNEADTFEANTKLPYLLRIVTTLTDTNGAFVDLQASNRFVLKGTEPCQKPNPLDCHPKYVLDPAVVDVEGFYNVTYQRWKEGTCGEDPGGQGGAGGGLGVGGQGGAGGGNE